MPDVVAKAMAVITGFLLVFVVGVLVVTSRPPAGSRQVVAEFRDAFPVLEGMQVRTDGAISGSIGKITVDDKGLAAVTLLVNKSIPEPKANAVAQIRQADSTGDSYVAYDPGTGAKPLADVDGKPTIVCGARDATSPCANTLASPRLDDLVNAFGPPEQAGIKLILQNLSAAVAGRGGDVNRAALKLLPALDAANKAVTEVNTQNTALKKLITDMESVSGQAASKRVELGRLIDGLAETVKATAAHTQPLDAGITQLPSTEAALQKTFSKLARTATAARPLAAELATAAPQLGAVLGDAPGFLDDVKFALRQGKPTLGLTRKLLAASAPTIEADPQRLVTGAFDLAPALSNLLKGILGGDDTIKAFFADETNGAPTSKPGFGFGLGAAATEPGNVFGFPQGWASRNWIRVDAVLDCQAFGIPVSPGCLSGLLAARRSKTAGPSKLSAKVQSATQQLASHLRPPANLTPKPQPVLPKVRVPDVVQNAPQKLQGILDYLLGG